MTNHYDDSEEIVGESQYIAENNAPKRMSKRLGVFIVILVAAAVIYFVGGALWAGGMPRPDADKWQAVFLNNNQVYFGKLSIAGRENIILRQIFYLRANQPLQQGTTQGPELSLIKLGSELHGPEDEMFISKDSLLFWENMKDDSAVVSAIRGVLAGQQ